MDRIAAEYDRMLTQEMTHENDPAYLAQCYRCGSADGIPQGDDTEYWMDTCACESRAALRFTQHGGTRRAPELCIECGEPPMWGESLTVWGTCADCASFNYMRELEDERDHLDW